MSDFEAPIFAVSGSERWRGFPIFGSLGFGLTRAQKAPGTRVEKRFSMSYNNLSTTYASNPLQWGLFGARVLGSCWIVSGTSGAVIHRLYENGTGGTVVNRYKGFEVEFGGTTQFTNTYGYDNAGRLQTVSDSGGVIGTYAYTANSASMVATLTRQTGSAGALVSTNTWLQFHDRLDVVANTLAGASTSAYDYAVNALGQRTSVATSGSAFSGITGASWSSWGYNNHGEVTSATHSSDATRNRSFIYDSIGNRKNSRNGSTTAVGYEVNSPNSTNKYTALFADNNNNGARDAGETTTASPVHDDDGNMTDDGGSGTTGRTFVWDAEPSRMAGGEMDGAQRSPKGEGAGGRRPSQNRLIQVKDKSTTPKLLATYTYDYRGRRVKKVTTADAVQGATQIAYLYDGWNVIAEYDLTAGNPSASPTKRHDWGLDLSGSLRGAGGVGGLIRTKITSTSYFPTYDGNGNICELVNASNGTFGARYHYDPFGNTIYESGSAAISNLYRFSSKPVDRESGFYYYGYRYYDASRGRWLNRDPIGARGGINLYGFVRNNSVKYVDPYGLQPHERPTFVGERPWMSALAKGITPVKLGSIKPKPCGKCTISASISEWGEGQMSTTTNGETQVANGVAIRGSIGADPNCCKPCKELRIIQYVRNLDAAGNPRNSVSSDREGETVNEPLSDQHGLRVDSGNNTASMYMDDTGFARGGDFTDVPSMPSDTVAGFEAFTCLVCMSGKVVDGQAGRGATLGCLRWGWNVPSGGTSGVKRITPEIVCGPPGGGGLAEKLHPSVKK
jgi:RHS repeat-associated protein